jgi:hypothetical protein
MTTATVTAATVSFKKQALAPSHQVDDRDFDSTSLLRMQGAFIPHVRDGRAMLYHGTIEPFLPAVLAYGLNASVFRDSERQAILEQRPSDALVNAAKQLPLNTKLDYSLVIVVCSSSFESLQPVSLRQNPVDYTSDIFKIVAVINLKRILVQEVSVLDRVEGSWDISRRDRMSVCRYSMTVPYGDINSWNVRDVLDALEFPRIRNPRSNSLSNYADSLIWYGQNQGRFMANVDKNKVCSIAQKHTHSVYRKRHKKLVISLVDAPQ